MTEILSEIKIIGCPVLQKKTALVLRVTQAERELLSKMAQVMYEERGIGLAANQIGVDKCMAVIDVGDGLYKLVNPRIIKKEGKQSSEEGCLSIPGASVNINRAKKVEVNALNEMGEPVTLRAEGLMACCLQHEIDHLNGKTIFDYASFFQKRKIKKTLLKLQRSPNDENLCQLEGKPRKL